MDELYEATITCRDCKCFNSMIDDGYCEVYNHSVSPHEEICDEHFELDE